MKIQYVLCRYCIINGQPKTFGHIGAMPISEDKLFDHIEQSHHIPVIRKGETERMALVRHKKQNPKSGTKDCQCPNCDASALFKI